ncbi:MAG: hypothetical protein IJ657_03265 [Acidaminococcaceae bacterium]|nr:hypothetical protein [Acidaminococcaceae bacterium]MBR1590078.1 hypothetical protein [Acidaminococcaceae bacterium]
MKKKFTLFLMAVMMSFSAMCFASHGTDLDAEEKIVDQFFAGKDYNKIVASLEPALAKDLTADRYKEIFADMEKTLGKLTQKDLRVFRVFEDGHILSYAAKYEKAPAMEIDVVFKKDKGKLIMADFRVLDPAAQNQEPANSEAEKK